MTNNVYIKKYRNAYNNGTVYSLIWNSLMDYNLHSETIVAQDSNPISEDRIKYMLLMMAVHKDPNTIIDTISESLPVQEVKE